MPNIAISALPVAASQAGADVLPIVQATTSTTKQLSVTNLFTSPAFVTPALGTVASGVISACTSTGMVLAAPVLGTVASGNISACTSTSMVMVTPVLGTPTSGNISNCTSTSMVLTTPVLGTPTSGNLSNCTSTSMVLTTPVIGAATGTSLSTTGNIVVSSTGKVGYATGSGGTVTQATSKATGVTLSKSTGQITLNNAALNLDTTVSFTLTNTVIEANDILILNHISGGTAGSYLLNAQSAAGSASINVRNITAGSLSEAIVIAFAVIKAVIA
jgi:hypothetical protein